MESSTARYPGLSAAASDPVRIPVYCRILSRPIPAPAVSDRWFPAPGPEARRARRKRPRLFGGGFYAELEPESKVPRSTFTPGPIVEDRLTF
jgi:hypothetical protein